MRIAITGAAGQLGKELALWPHLEPENMLFPLTRSDLDVTNEEQCLAVFQRIQPEVIIHCAAYTAVDLAEADPEAAYAVNSRGTRNVALAAKAVGAKLCYISTDYVIDGKATLPYETDAMTNPTSVYGKSKLAGELAVQELVDRHYIVRTSWVFGSYGNNFVKTMLRIGAEKRELQVVNDQQGSPTYTYDLANLLLQLVKTENYGMFHVSNSDSCSWYDFAKSIFQFSEMDVEVVPCSTEQFPRPAKRPAYSVFSHHAIRAAGLPPMRSWQEALRYYLKHELEADS
ncbi:dTDP-4-dehydrorhamnose reductase [Paenibacillus sp. strain BS8-2]